MTRKVKKDNLVKLEEIIQRNLSTLLAVYNHTCPEFSGIPEGGGGGGGGG